MKYANVGSPADGVSIPAQRRMPNAMKQIKSQRSTLDRPGELMSLWRDTAFSSPALSPTDTAEVADPAAGIGQRVVQGHQTVALVAQLPGEQRNIPIRPGPARYVRFGASGTTLTVD
ncbi:MAG: hypothetical protein U5O39_12825 [Gammaproteobacteria bacterium]|nr:hypothetical protein [Gammaproteobacteria bacterium]